MDNNEYKGFIEKQGIIDELFDVIRIVDPITRKTIKSNIADSSILDFKCYNMWKRNELCETCVSGEAYVSREKCSKVVLEDGKIFFVLAIPKEIDGELRVIEVIKDISDSKVEGLEDGHDSDNSIVDNIDNLNDFFVKDCNTRLIRKNFIKSKLSIDIRNTRLVKQRLSVMMIDIDQFKSVNDTYGHLVGDEVLKEFSQRLQSCLRRDGDWIGRFGGDEILVSLPGASLEKAVDIAEFMRTEICDRPFLIGDIRIELTASFGLYCVNAIDKTDYDIVIEAADKKLYLAKKKGRNRVEY